MVIINGVGDGRICTAVGLGKFRVGSAATDQGNVPHGLNKSAAQASTLVAHVAGGLAAYVRPIVGVTVGKLNGVPAYGGWVY